MMRGKYVVGVVVVALLAAGCAMFTPPEDCGVGGTADEAAFGQYFQSMQLVDQATGAPGVEGEEGTEFGSGTSLVIRFESTQAVELRVCIMERKAGGEIVLDETWKLGAAAGELVLGEMAPGAYVARVSVDGVLVKNFAFVIK